jgi:hypothetical protein
MKYYVLAFCIFLFLALVCFVIAPMVQADVEAARACETRHGMVAVYGRGGGIFCVQGERVR